MQWLCTREIKEELKINSRNLLLWIYGIFEHKPMVGKPAYISQNNLLFLPNMRESLQVNMEFGDNIWFEL